MTTYTRYDSITIDNGPANVGMLIQGTLWAVNDNTSWKIVTPNNNTYIISEDPSAPIVSFNNVNLTNSLIALIVEYKGLLTSPTIVAGNQGMIFTLRAAGTTDGAGRITAGFITLLPHTCATLNITGTIRNQSTDTGASCMGYYYLNNLLEFDLLYAKDIFIVPPFGTPPYMVFTLPGVYDPTLPATLSVTVQSAWNSTPVDFVINIKLTYV